MESGGEVAFVHLDVRKMTKDAIALLQEHLPGRLTQEGGRYEVEVRDNAGDPIRWDAHDLALSHALELKRTLQQKFSFSLYSKTGITLSRPDDQPVRFFG